MNIRLYSAQIGIAGQIQPSDIPEITRAGYRLVICNRPDGEEPGQPAFAELAEVAGAVGIRALHLPVAGPDDIARQVPAMVGALRSAPGPALVFCRSGARSSALLAAAGL